MRDHVILWYQCSGKFPIWDFCYSAVFGAEQNGTKHKPFGSIDQIDGSPYNVIVGSVEECSRWLTKNGYEVPQEIDVQPSIYRVAFSKEGFLAADIYYPCFIKPKGQIKAFTGTVVKDKVDAEIVLNYYEGDIWTSKAVEFVSEWRAYVHRGKLLKVCQYKGEPTIFPDSDVVLFYTRKYADILPHKAFTVDFGVHFLGLKHEETSVIEGNDMWAIANYGLEPDHYYQAVKDRWLQITGIL